MRISVGFMIVPATLMCWSSSAFAGCLVAISNPQSAVWRDCSRNQQQDKIVCRDAKPVDEDYIHKRGWRYDDQCPPRQDSEPAEGIADKGSNGKE